MHAFVLLYLTLAKYLFKNVLIYRLTSIRAFLYYNVLRYSKYLSPSRSFSFSNLLRNNRSAGRSSQRYISLDIHDCGMSLSEIRITTMGFTLSTSSTINRRVDFSSRRREQKSELLTRSRRARNIQQHPETLEKCRSAYWKVRHS